MSLLERAKEVPVNRESSRLNLVGSSKYTDEECMECFLGYLRGDIKLKQIRHAMGSDKKDTNAAYRLIARGVRLAMEQGRIRIVGDPELEQGF